MRWDTRDTVQVVFLAAMLAVMWADGGVSDVVRWVFVGVVVASVANAALLCVVAARWRRRNGDAVFSRTEGRDA